MMFRAISETAVAIRVASVRENPRRRASARASARAGTRSSFASMVTRTSSTRRRSLESIERLVQVECGAERVEVEPEMNHRDRDLRLDADDDRLGAAKTRGDRDVAQRARRERIDHVESRHVDHDPAEAKAPDALEELGPKREDLAVAQVGLDRREDGVAPADDGDGHGLA